MPRLSPLFEDAIKIRSAQALETPELEKAMLIDMPKATEEMIHKRWNATFCPSVSLHSMPQPKRPWSVPYEDEHNRVLHVNPVKASL